MENLTDNMFSMKIEKNLYKKQHELANEYKVLCISADDMSKEVQKGKFTNNDWVVVDNYQDKRSNFKGVLYEKDGKYVLAFVGTDKFSIKDHGANLKMGLTGDSRQIEQAKIFTQDMINKYDLTPSNTTSTGHSEGGTEATYVGLEFGFTTFTFNAYGVHKSHFPKDQDFNLVINYRDPHDPVSKLHSNVGNTFITPSTQNSLWAISPFGLIQAHGIKNMGDCTKAVPLQEYKKRNPYFIDKISEVEISRKNIAQMDGNLFSIYEKEIDKRLKENRIKNYEEHWVTINGNHVLIKD